ncbi:MAG TPA: four-helix bundle copper-binding protein [Chthonomonadaceae bacterium]|nr:four-helix bundle copper-binding protein [Chthonomonadaceae bacterium]
MGNPMERCISLCQQCHVVCETAVQHCLTQGGRHAQPDHVRLLRDCSEICQTSANFMLRGSPLHVKTCAACSAICGACARECEQWSGDVEMQRCAEACAACSAECAKMAQMAA